MSGPISWRYRRFRTGIPTITCATHRALPRNCPKPNRTEPVWANQFDNVANRHIHVQTTAPEIWEQTSGRVDGFICAVGTGGDAGRRRRRAEVTKSRREDRLGRSNGCNPAQLLHDRRAQGRGKFDNRRHRAGKDNRQSGGPWRSTFRTRCPDEEMLTMVFNLLTDEGLCMGGSSGMNVAGAVRMARDMGPGHTIVTVLCDYGTRYQSRLFNPDFLRSKGLPVPGWLGAPYRQPAPGLC